jgi:hypothetical protein
MSVDLQNYSANDRQLDEALDAVLGPLPKWQESPVDCRLVLPNCLNNVHLDHCYGGNWITVLCLHGSVTAESIEDIQRRSIDLMIDQAERTLADLRAYREARELEVAREASVVDPCYAASGMEVVS